MADIQALIEKLKQRKAQEQAAYSERISLAESHGVEYDERRRVENLRLLRSYFNATQEDFAGLLGLSGQPEYSQIETGSKAIPSSAARRIEQRLSIPENWLDRDNSKALFISLAQFAVLMEIGKRSDEAARALAEAIRKIGSVG